MRAISWHYELGGVTFAGEAHPLAVVAVCVAIILLASYRAGAALLELVRAEPANLAASYLLTGTGLRPLP